MTSQYNYHSITQYDISVTVIQSYVTIEQCRRFWNKIISYSIFYTC